MNRYLVAGLVVLLPPWAGLVRAHEVGDLVFCDANGNGVYEPPADKGIPGATVARNCGGGITTRMTNADGRYVFPGSDGDCTYAVDTSSGPAAGLAITTPLLGIRPPPTAEHSAAGGFGCGSCPSAIVNTVPANGVFRTIVNNPCNCQDAACTSGLDACLGTPPFVGYYGDDFGFQCSPSTTTSTITTSTTTSSTSSTTTSSTTTTLPAHHFQCYEVDHAPFGQTGLTLNDRYGTSTVDLIEAKRLCNPVDENGQNPGAPGQLDHLVGYIIRQTSPPFTRISQQLVTNEFGTITVDLVRPVVLLVPSAKSLTAPPPPLEQTQTDHFECYRVSGGRQRVAGVTLVDEFGSLTIDIKRPYRLCTAVDVDGQGIIDPTANLFCYKVRTSPGTPPFRGPGNPVFINDEFEARALQVKHLRELCVWSTVSPAASPGP